MIRRARRGVFVALLLMFGGLAWSTQAASGQYIAMSVEVAQAGSWYTLSETFLGTNHALLNASEQSSYQHLLSSCMNVQGCVCAYTGALSTKPTRTFSIVPQIGKVYRVRLQNLTACRVGVVLGIDGMNTVDGQHVTGSSRDAKWILDGGRTYAIEGWQTTQQQALEFYFTLPSDSASPYSAEIGSINAYVFFEEPKQEIITLDFSITGESATGAGQVIQQPTKSVEFTDATTYPAEIVTIRYSQSPSSGRPSIGFTCQNTSGLGVMIIAVAQGKPAQQYGLQVGDIITQVDGQNITSCTDIANLLDGKSPGDYMIFKIHRNTGVFTISVRLG